MGSRAKAAKSLASDVSGRTKSAASQSPYAPVVPRSPNGRCSIRTRSSFTALVFHTNERKRRLVNSGLTA